MLHELRLHAHKLAYDFSRRMKLLPASVHRIVALVDVFESELLSNLHGKVDSICVSNVLHPLLKVSLDSDSSG